MATTRIIPMHLNKGKTLAQCLADRTEYGMNPDKTEGGALISAFACEPETAVSEFALSKREYRELTGRVQESDVIAYQVRQSFKPGEVTPEEANRIGYEFAKRFLKGRHAFLVCTHTDKKHIHNHIYWNSTALDCTRKFKNFIGSYRAVRRLSDLICAEHRLSVVENPQKHGLSYNKWRGGHDKLSNRDLLRMAIDAALEKQPGDFDALLALLKDSGYSVARKSRLSLRHENQKQSIRLDSLGEGYSEQELRAVLAGSRTHKPFVRKKYPKRRERATLIADIEANLNAGKGYRYDQAMKVVKLKQMAKTLIYLEEKGFADFDALVNAAADAEKTRLQGEGQANYRREIANGIVDQIKSLQAVGMNINDVNNVVLFNQYLDVMRSLSESNNTKTVVLPASTPGGYQDLYEQVTKAMLTASETK